MKEKIPDKTIDLLLSGIEKILNDKKKNFQWRKLFIDTGKFFIENTEKSKSFEEDLFAIFSEENMKTMANNLSSQRGYEFPKLLHDKLYHLMVKYDIDTKDAETYIHHFSQVIINNLLENDHDRILEMYLGAWREEAQKNYEDISVKIDMLSEIVLSLKETDAALFSISDIDEQIIRESKSKGMDLSFFELDDEQFEIKLQEAIGNEIIYVVGKSREETIYRILNELREKNSDKATLIIKSENEWKRLGNTNLSGTILIPFFYAERITAIRNNTNIFVYSEDEPCYSQNKLELRKRTKKNIINSLEKIGYSGTDAYNLVDNTHGLYVPLKKKLFNGAIHSRPDWIKEHSGPVMAALLCGKWTEANGDKQIFEELAGKKYEECKKELSNYSHGENPFVVTYNGYAGNNMQLASVEDAWEELDIYVSYEMWQNFLSLFYKVLIESEPIFELPFDKHFEASSSAKQSNWSPVLKHGMIRTLVMRAYYRGHEEFQMQIDEAVKHVLDTITAKERWGYISQYMTDLCEASPGSVLYKLENEFKNPTGLIDFFGAKDGDSITGQHYYTHVLWAVEQLLQQKEYAVRAIKWLWKINSYEINYSISNSPKSILENVFCAWMNLSAISLDSKIELAKEALNEYDNAWEIIEINLPNSRNVVFPLSALKYRTVDEPGDLRIFEVNNTYIEYLRMCVDVIGTDTNKWKKIIEYLQWYDADIQNEIIDKIVYACKLMTDYEKMQIKNAIRYFIYSNRAYSDANWSADTEILKKYEQLLNIIKTEKPEYEYVYLFSPRHEFPLLNPIIYHSDQKGENRRIQNEILREREIISKLKEFKKKKFSLARLIEAAIQDNKDNVGNVLAQFYCEEIYDEKVFELLAQLDKDGKHIYDFIKTLYYKKAVELNEILIKVKKLTKNDNLVVNLIKLQIIDDYEKTIIVNESEEIKKAYWSLSSRTQIKEDANVETCKWALDECYKYGTLDTYIELLYDLKDNLKPAQIYKYVIKIYEINSNMSNSMIKYYLEEILTILQNDFMNEKEWCQNIAKVEWYCRSILNWDQMKCMQYEMKSDPAIYANLVKIIYKADPNDAFDEEKANLASKLYSGFHKAKFCPTESHGKVKYEEIKNWVEKFKKLLAAQRQERLFDSIIGELLVYSPMGDDGYMPCEAVRNIIEEYYSESLKKSYIIAEKNKRGVHIVDAGKSEFKLYEKYKDNAEALQYKYPHTADIYFALSNSYKKQAKWERKRAEDEW